MENYDVNLDFRNWLMNNYPLVYLNHRFTSDVDDKHEV